jgi:fructose-1,6-bisphosphatase/inositol monophosphatase family enzyme
VFGIIDQPVLGERWVGIQGQVSMLNGDAIQTRASCDLLKNAYLYTTSPHMFSGESELAFSRVRNKVSFFWQVLSSGFSSLAFCTVFSYIFLNKQAHTGG